MLIILNLSFKVYLLKLIDLLITYALGGKVLGKHVINAGVRNYWKSVEIERATLGFMIKVAYTERNVIKVRLKMINRKKGASSRPSANFHVSLSIFAD